MKALSVQGTLDLEVRNFGPIAEAKIDLRPLTVFVGPSNTGKSYLAILIYALHRYFSGLDWFGRLDPSSMSHRIKANELSEEIIDISKKIKKMLTDEDESSPSKRLLLPDMFKNVIRDALEREGDHIENEISRCFGTETGALIREGSRGGAHVNFHWCNATAPAPILHHLKIGAQATEFEKITFKGTPIWIDSARDNLMAKRLYRIAARTQRGGDGSDFHADYFLETLADYVYPQIVGFFGLPAYYLPAGRTGVMHAHNLAVSTLFAGATRTGLRPIPGIPMLSGVLADFFEQLLEFDQRRKSRHGLDKQIEKAVLKGSIEVDKSGVLSYPHFIYKPQESKRSFPLMNASSMVSELAPVVLYLRHIVGSNNVLIFDEPEAHLHPEMQVELIYQLAAAVDLGLRVIITTHSEWILEGLANVVLRSRHSKSSRKNSDTSGGCVSLRPDQVGAWLFQPKRRPKGSKVREITLEDYRLYEAGYDKVARELYNEWVRVSD